PLRAGRHPRGRPRRRGDHPEPPDDPKPADDVAWPSRHDGRGRSPRRGLYAARRVREAQPEPRRCRRDDVRQPPQRGGRRPAAAGAVRQKDPATTARRPLDIFLYHVSEARELGFTTYAETLEALRAAGFKVNPRTEPCRTLDAVVTYCERLEAGRDGLGYDADGAVIKVDSLEQQWRV